MASGADLEAKVDEAVRSGALTPAAAANMKPWLTEPAYEAYRERLEEDIAAGRWGELDTAFFQIIEFGTGGMRGPMYPVGTSVLNARTIAEAARGLADYVAATGPASAALRSAVIAHDTRHNSRNFAEICARVLLAAGFRVTLLDGPRSTPQLSFAVRHLGCDAGIMITASHNPPADNGFKCYDRHGNQVVPPDDRGIIECYRATAGKPIPEADLATARQAGQLATAGRELDEAYIAAVVSESVCRTRDVSIVYTPLHGVGESSVAASLRTAGFTRLNVLEAQRSPDGDFPTVPGRSANPENPKALDLAIEEARRTWADLVIASDPDADRIGVAVPTTGDPRGGWTCLDGNQIGALLGAFVMKQTEARGKLRPDHYLVTTLVSGQMLSALAKREGVRVVDDLLVGFKWIGKAIDENGHAGFLFAFEESHGYLKGDHVRDKDAAVAALLFAELAATVKDRQQTVLEYLDDLYIDVGHFGERLLNRYFEGSRGVEQAKALMQAFREVPPTHVGDLDVAAVHDYKSLQSRQADGTTELLPEPAADLLIFDLATPGHRFAVRPSGTEPKMKIYLFARTGTHGISDPARLAEVKERTAARLDRMTADLEKYIQSALVEFGG